MSSSREHSPAHSPRDFDDALRARVTANLERFVRRRHASADLTAAAVAVVLVADAAGRASFVLTRRASRLKDHPGQWALPGGRLEPGETHVEAALRECREEIGLELATADVLGVLDDYPTRSGYVITPVVAWAGRDCRLVANEEEVAKIYRVPLRDLDRPGVPRVSEIAESERPLIAVPLLGTHIHAPTAALLYQLREVAIHGRDTRVAHYEQPVFAWK